MSKKIRKLAVIRSDNDQKCPYGLPISSACQNVGEVIYRMAPIDVLGSDSSEEEKFEITEANNHLYRWKSEGEQCPFAGKIFKKISGTVECNWGSNAPGQAPNSLKGSPLFWRMFGGGENVGLNGLFSYPLNMYYAPFSIESMYNDDED